LSRARTNHKDPDMTIEIESTGQHHDLFWSHVPDSKYGAPSAWIATPYVDYLGGRAYRARRLYCLHTILNEFIARDRSYQGVRLRALRDRIDQCDRVQRLAATLPGFARMMGLVTDADGPVNI
jgi:hypothetical protein